MFRFNRFNSRLFKGLSQVDVFSKPNLRSKYATVSVRCFLFPNNKYSVFDENAISQDVVFCRVVPKYKLSLVFSMIAISSLKTFFF